MVRLRPVHRLTDQEAELSAAIHDERRDETERGRNERLKARIEAYWRERGFTVRVVLHDGPFSNAMREARVDLRSDLVNGLPQGELAKVEQG